ncbi:MAG TPA: transglutaminase-like domain-containing protein [Acidimicrobiales bacterium]|nr:transglutaminase-like domain-containing protein [Acidimicrobiales bacterium]
MTRRFAALLDGPPDSLPVDEVLLLVAAHDHPVDVALQRARLDDLAARCTPGSLESVLDVVFAQEGFQGDRDDYHHPDNSFLDRVLDRHRGLPILLSVLTAEVAARNEVCLAPVGMPGHFLLRVCDDEDTFVDPFDRGRLLDPAGCRAIFASLHPDRPFDPAFLDPIDSRAVVVRVVTNLLNTFLQRGPVASLAWAAQLRAIVLGGEAWRLAARLRERTGDWDLAAQAWDALGEGAGADQREAAARAGAARARTN